MTMSASASVLDSSLYIAELKKRSRGSVLHELVACAYAAGIVRDPILLRETLALRERLGLTPVLKSVAVPHARSLAVIEPRIVVARSHRGVDWGAADALPVHVVLLVLSPSEWSEEAHADSVVRAASAARLQRQRQKLLDATAFAGVALALGDLSP